MKLTSRWGKETRRVTISFCCYEDILLATNWSDIDDVKQDKKRERQEEEEEEEGWRDGHLRGLVSSTNGWMDTAGGGGKRQEEGGQC